MRARKSSSRQSARFEKAAPPPRFPSTRYQGSKARLADWIGRCVEGLEFDSALDAFGGTAAVSYLFKRLGKAVTYNDHLKFNSRVAGAILGHTPAALCDAEARALFGRDPGRAYGDVVERNFKGIYYTEDENRWIDTVAGNLADLPPEGRAIAFFALCQSCLVKRPFNLFHRRNLDLRTRAVTRGFGNKTTWDTPFETHFLKYAAEASAARFDSRRSVAVLNRDVLEVDGAFDLVYIDPPYVRADGTAVDYTEFYHFLEGLADYEHWESRIDFESRHRRLRHERSAWSDPARVVTAYEALFDRFSGSILALSTRSDGSPSVPELVAMMKRLGKKVAVHEYGRFTYALSTNRSSKEVLIVGA